MVIYLVPADLVLEVPQISIRINQHELHPGHIGKIHDMLLSEVLAVAGVVRSTGEYPGSGCCFQVRFRIP